ncbi:Ribonuclease HII (fragment) [Agrobacterium salinitolerans str. Hayward 0363]
MAVKSLALAAAVILEYFQGDGQFKEADPAERESLFTQITETSIVSVASSCPGLI